MLYTSSRKKESNHSRSLCSLIGNIKKRLGCVAHILLWRGKQDWNRSRSFFEFFSSTIISVYICTGHILRSINNSNEPLKFERNNKYSKSTTIENNAIFIALAFLSPTGTWTRKTHSLHWCDNIAVISTKQTENLNFP